MKYLIFLCAVLFSLSALGQQYAPFYPDRTDLFLNDSDQHLRGIAIRDSSDQNSGMYFHFHVMDLSNLLCVSPFGTSWIGDSVQMESDSLFHYFNEEGLPIHIRPLSSLWTLYTYPNGDKIQASLSGIDTTTVNGQLDSTKTFSLSVIDGMGAAVVNDISGKTITLSKQNGWVSTMPWGWFPRESDSYSLTSFNRMTFGDVYDYEVGDEWQIENGSAFFRYRVLSKSWSLVMDTVSYDLEKETFTPSVVPPFYSLDTVSHSYTNLDQYIYEKMPDELFGIGDFDSSWHINGRAKFSSNSQSGGYRSYIGPGGRQYMASGGNIPNREKFLYPLDSCLSATEPFEPISLGGEGIYIKGIGVINVITYDLGAFSEEKLIYWKKGSESWGNLVSGLETMQAELWKVRLFPTPASGKMFVEFEVPQRSTVRMEIMDLQGRTIHQEPPMQANSGVQVTMPLSLESIPAGMYLLRIRTDQGQISRKFMISH